MESKYSNCCGAVMNEQNILDERCPKCKEYAVPTMDLAGKIDSILDRITPDVMDLYILAEGKDHAIYLIKRAVDEAIAEIESEEI